MPPSCLGILNVLIPVDRLENATRLWWWIRLGYEAWCNCCFFRRRCLRDKVPLLSVNDKQSKGQQEHGEQYFLTSHPVASNVME